MSLRLFYLTPPPKMQPQWPKVIDEMSLVYEVANRQLFISASIGVAISPMDGHDEHSLLKAADAAMYKAKENGRNRFAF